MLRLLLTLASSPHRVSALTESQAIEVVESKHTAITAALDIVSYGLSEVHSAFSDDAEGQWWKRKGQPWADFPTMQRVNYARFLKTRKQCEGPRGDAKMFHFKIAFARKLGDLSSSFDTIAGSIRDIIFTVAPFSRETVSELYDRYEGFIRRNAHPRHFELNGEDFTCRVLTSINHIRFQLNFVVLLCDGLENTNTCFDDIIEAAFNMIELLAKVAPMHALGILEDLRGAGRRYL